MFSYGLLSKRKMAIRYEDELYQPVKNWLNQFLIENIQAQFVKTFIGANEKMNKILLREEFSSEIEELGFFEFKIDVFATLRIKNKIRLVIVECKKNPIGLIHLGQLIGYSQIIRPWRSVLLSPKGTNSNLNKFINVHKMSHLLQYGQDGQISICGWDTIKKQPINILPTGSLDPVSFF